MSKTRNLVFCALLSAIFLLAACSPAAPAAAPAHPTDVSAAVADTPSPASAPLKASTIKVGLVTDTGGVNDQAFNQMAWAGIQKASQEMGFQSKYIESVQPSDYGKNIDALAAEGYNVIITVGDAMGDATAAKAGQYPNIKFAIVDHAFPDGSLSNVTSLMFAEDQAGFMAGVLAGGLSHSGFVCSVSNVRTPASSRYMISFFQGATWQAGAEVRFMNNYINLQTTEANVPTIDDATQGKETAQKLIGNGCDVVFGIGGDAVNGVLLAAREANLPAIGADVDRYNTSPDARPALVTSAMKNVDAAVYAYLKSVADGTVKAGASTANVQNGGVGLAPFHDWDGRIPADLKSRLQQAADGIKDGSIKIEMPSE